MKILRCIHSANPQGGGPIANVLGMQKPLEDRGHQVELACLDDPKASFIEDLNLPVTPLGPATPGFGFSRKWKSWMVENLSRFDVVILHGLWQYPAFSVPPLAKARGIPYYIYPHGMLDPWFNKAYPTKRWKKQVYWWLSQHRNLAGAEALLFTSEEEKVQARLSFNPYRVKERVVTYGIPDPPEPTSDPPSLTHGKPYLLFLGRIHEKKGIDLLIEAYRKWPLNREVDLVLAGPNRAPHLTERVGTLDSLNIHLPGMLTGDEKWHAFRNAEAFILPSHQENFGVAVAEALACSTPVLISQKVNIWKEIQEVEAGIIQPDTQEGTEKLLHSWSELSPQKRDQMKKNARTLFLEKFEVQRAAADLERIIQTDT